MKGVLIAVITNLTLVIVALSVVLHLMGDATITNDLALEQLNGGDAAYLALQGFHEVCRRIEIARNTLCAANLISSGILICTIIKEN